MKTVHVIGAGGIGVVLGHALARAGWDVTFVEANPAKVEAGNRDGASVDGVAIGEARFVPFDSWNPPADALLLLCTKTYDNAAVLERIGARRDLLIPVQNGFDSLLAESGHPLEGISSFVSQCERDRPATRITRAGETYLGGRRPLAPDERATLQNLAATLRAGGLPNVRVVDDIAPYKSAKLMYNAAISPLAAAAGVDNAALLTDRTARRLFFALLRENYAILRSRGVQLARIGPFSPWLVNKILSTPGLARLLAVFFRPGLRGTYCSMAPDMNTGHTEIAAYNGYLIGLARSVACPINTAVLEMMNTMQANRESPHREALERLNCALGRGGAV